MRVSTRRSWTNILFMDGCSALEFSRRDASILTDAPRPAFHPIRCPMLASLAFIVAAYLIGSISFAVVTSKLFGLPDPHTYGSGNPGATNVLRTGNKTAAVLTVLGDGAKGWLAVWLTQRFGPAFEVLPWTVPAA